MNGGLNVNNGQQYAIVKMSFCKLNTNTNVLELGKYEKDFEIAYPR